MFELIATIIIWAIWYALAFGVPYSGTSGGAAALMVAITVIAVAMTYAVWIF